MPSSVTEKPQSPAQQQRALTQEEFNAAFDYADTNQNGKVDNPTERMRFMEKAGGGYKSNGAYRSFALGIEVAGQEGTTSLDLAKFYGKEGFTKTQFWEDYQQRNPNGVAQQQANQQPAPTEASKANGENDAKGMWFVKLMPEEVFNKYAPDGVINNMNLLEMFTDEKLGYVTPEEKKVLAANNGEDKTPEVQAALQNIIKRWQEKKSEYGAMLLENIEPKLILPRGRAVNNWADLADNVIFSFDAKFAKENDQKRYVLDLSRPEQSAPPARQQRSNPEQQASPK